MDSAFGSCERSSVHNPVCAKHEISVKLPVMVRVENVGATFIAGNVTLSSHIMHVNRRYKHVNLYVEDGMVKKVFVKSADKISNILTKNLTNNLHLTHSNKIIGEKLE